MGSLRTVPSSVAAAIARLRLGESQRAGGATLLSLLAHGERVAMRGADRQAQIAPDYRVRRFLRAQARHEAFHARVFDTAGRWLMPDDSPGVAMPGELAVLEQRLESACEQRDFAATLLVQQVFLEGLGHVALQRLNGKIAAGGDYLAHLRGLILRQEAAHHRFGVTMLARYVDQEPGVAVRLAPLGRELFQIVTGLLARFDATLDHVEATVPDDTARLRNTLPDWLKDAVP